MTFADNTVAMYFKYVLFFLKSDSPVEETLSVTLDRGLVADTSKCNAFAEMVLLLGD